MVFGFGAEKKKRTPISKSEWEARKKQSGNKCIICGESEKKVGGLRKAHIKAHSKGGTQYFPLCSNCHTKYDKGLLLVKELKKLGLTKEKYARLKPKKLKKSNSRFF